MTIRGKLGGANVDNLATYLRTNVLIIFLFFNLNGAPEETHSNNGAVEKISPSILSRTKIPHITFYSPYDICTLGYRKGTLIKASMVGILLRRLARHCTWHSDVTLLADWLANLPDVWSKLLILGM